MNKIGILLADDHSITRMGLAMLLSGEPDMKVVGEANNGRDAVRLARALKPDVVIMDLVMPVLPGAEAVRQIHDEDPDIRIIVLTTFSDSAELVTAVRNGASATLFKDMETCELADSVRKVHAGETILPDTVRGMLDEDVPLLNMTDRQRDILHSITRGLKNADIALQLGISESAVKKHLKNLFSKLGAATRAEAAAIALRKHLLKI